MQGQLNFMLENRETESASETESKRVTGREGETESESKTEINYGWEEVS